MHALTHRSSTRTLFLIATVLALAVALLPLLAQPAHAATTWYVDDSGTDHPSRGGESNPFKSISYAMLRASQGDTIMVKPGTYSVAKTGEDVSITFKPKVRLISTEGPDQTKIRGTGAQAAVRIVNGTAGTTLQGFTIRGGGGSVGAGVDCIWLGPGSAPGWPLIAENIIDKNTAAAGFGGGIYLYSSGGPLSPVIRDNLITENGATLGAGVYCSSMAEPLLIDNFFWGNTATNSGGAVYASGLSDPTIIGGWFVNNSALGVAGGGGAITYVMSPGTTTSIEGSYFGQNYAQNGGYGGAIQNASAGTTVRVTACYFEGNGSASGSGGAVYMQDGTCTMKNCVVANNSALSGTGNAVYAFSGQTTLTNCTVWGNNPGAAGIVGSFATPVVVKNCIVGGSGGVDLVYVNVANSIVQETNFSGQNVSTGAGVMHVDPRFVDVANHDLHLRASSPAIDSGASAGAPAEDFDDNARPLDGDGDGQAWHDMGAYEHPVLDAGRYAGADRYQTAVDIVAANFDEADTVVIASGEGFADALSAAGLAGAHVGPLLLVRPNEVPSAVLTLIATLGADDAIIVGGTAVVSESVKTQLEGAGLTVARVAGADRYETSEEVARAIAAEFDGDIGSVFVARGDAFPDALAVSPIAYAGGYPILLTQSSSLPDPIEDLLGDFDVDAAFMCGGTAAVSTAVETRVKTLIQPGDFDQVGRWAGADRYETAKAIAQGAIDEQYAIGGWSYLGIATGENFPDALAGGIAAGERDGLVLLTQRDSLPTATSSVLAAQKDVLQFVEIYGGAGAVSTSVEAAIESALGW